MSPLISRLLLSMLVVPFGAMAFALVGTFVTEALSWRYQKLGAALSGGGTWLLMVGYWVALWRTSVLWTRRRTYRTLESSWFCGAAGAGFGYFMAPMWGDVLASGVAAGAAAFAWFGWTTFIWRQTPEEAAAAAPVPCPVCGYSLSGLRSTSCPECGSTPTLDQLLSKQPSEALRSLKS
jgi:hypothetical protein